MRFNSVKSGDFTSAAKAVNRSADQMFQASRESAPDFTGISKAAIASRAKERNAATEAKGVKDRAKINADSLIDRSKIKSDLTKSLTKTENSSNRMAGVVGALGSIAGGFVMKSEKAAEKLDRQKQDARETKREEMMLAILNKPQPKFEFTEKPPEHPGTTSTSPSTPELTTTPDKSKPKNTDSLVTSQSLASSTTFTPQQEVLAKAVRNVEVGDLGYDGFNQFGDAGGHSNRGTGGKYGDKFGTPLTSMTLSEVMKRQSRHNDKSLSDSNWQSSGGIWAAGAYQFIPETLKGIVQRSGIDTNRKFDKTLQDELFKFHAGEIKGGKIGSTWVGMQNYSPEERSRYNDMLNNNF